MGSGHHKLSENIWFAWSRMSYSEDMEGCHARGRTTDGRTTEHEDRARILEAEFAMSRIIEMRPFSWRKVAFCILRQVAGRRSEGAF